ncbi:uncharacterized protein [Haliotis cracherodii]|uniref:uncharacterized protein n=1 Tax=Haliotis cracherodii TaxID=6455 RepID=UPI001EB0346A
MSVSHPLLKILKGSLLDLHNEQSIIRDSNIKLVTFCRALEDIFRCGLMNNSGWFSRCDFWTWISRISHCANPVLEQVIDYVRNCQKVKTVEGKGRLFIRAGLVKKKLDGIVHHICRDKQLLQMWYDPHRSILGNEILAEILMSLLKEVKGMTFRLLLKNASFLDISWEMPVYREYEFVPCDVLGIHFQEVNSYLLVVDVEAEGVAGEDGKVSPGDVMDDMFGESLRGVKRGKVQDLFHQYRGLPVYAGFVKSVDAHGQIFRPITKLLRQLDMDPQAILNETLRRQRQQQQQNSDNSDHRMPAHALLPEDEKDEIPVHGPDGRAVYTVTYLGEVFLGTDGRVDRIEDAVVNIINSSRKNPKGVTVETSETGIVVTDTETGKALLNHSYTEVSACGRRTDYLQHFGYIAGETTCNLAKRFVCHVFHSPSAEETKVILCSIAQGFERTHWFL